jgi:hypothetical protein
LIDATKARFTDLDRPGKWPLLFQRDNMQQFAWFLSRNARTDQFRSGWTKASLPGIETFLT